MKGEQSLSRRYLLHLAALSQGVSCLYPVLNGVASCITCAASVPLMYFSFLRVLFKITNPGVNRLVEHVINSFLVLIHKNLWNPLMWGMLVLCSCGTTTLMGAICLTYLNVFLELEIEARLDVICPYNFPIGFPLVLSAAQMAWFFPLRKCWLLQAVQDDKFPSLPLRCFWIGFGSFFFLPFSLSSVKCLTSLTAPGTGMLQPQEQTRHRY